MPRYQPNRLSAPPPTPDFDFQYRHPLPAPLNRLSYREVARDTGYSPATCHRILNDPQKLTRAQLAKLLGVYQLDFNQLLRIIIKVPDLPVTYDRVSAADVAATGKSRHATTTHTTSDDDTTPYQPARHRNGRPVAPLTPDQQRTPPPNLNPDELFEPQTPADKRAGRPPVKRVMTNDEFSSYDPEPNPDHPKRPDDDTWYNPAWAWWEYRRQSRPGFEPGLFALAHWRSVAEFDGRIDAASRTQRDARALEVNTAIIRGLPIPPFDPDDPRFHIEPTEPKRRGKGKKGKQTDD